MVNRFWPERTSYMALLAGLWLLVACQSGDTDLGLAVVKPDELAVEYLDTLSVYASTVMVPDTFTTSTDSTVLIGRWQDAQTGTVSAKAFTSVDYNSAHTLPEQTGIRFDSLVLELGYTFTHGDTLSLFSMAVHSLETTFEDGKTYDNVSSLPYQAAPLVQQAFRPQLVRGKRQARLRLPDALSRDFYNRLVNKQINDQSSMVDYWKGFALLGQSAGNAFLGFNLLRATSGLRLYYHGNDLNQTRYELRFPMEYHRFTQLTSNLSGSALQSLRSRTDAISSRQTGNVSFISAGAGLRTRLDIPALSQFSKPDRYVALNRAELVVQPVGVLRNDNALPPIRLTLYETNNRQELLASVPGGASGSSAVLATYGWYYNDLEQRDQYAFDLTGYVNNALLRQAPARALLLMEPVEQLSLTNRIRRVTIGDQRHATDKLRLRLLYTVNQGRQ
ncbi:DUF4270 family protein [Spirosoma montaniterrae]|uniref:DUF4270 domain-containing protein n=1 Tax=Spirosoma montaniterrae TaxID=1178516 RepID=A0A1P9WYG0_9BACT|nr:DUF4270 family protein [Spirosoma montaniterrae]AQG80410.1 hypothetical protein AWR27_14410 [Spirosoma montaniterrae]